MEVNRQQSQPSVRVLILLLLLGIVVGTIFGREIEGYFEVFPIIEWHGWQIFRPILNGIAAALAVQLFSIVSIWTVFRVPSPRLFDLLFTIVLCCSIGISFGTIAVLNTSDRMTALGFLVPYIIDLSLPFIVVLFAGFYATHMLVLEAICLILFYAIANGLRLSINIFIRVQKNMTD